MVETGPLRLFPSSVLGGEEKPPSHHPSQRTGTFISQPTSLLVCWRPSYWGLASWVEWHVTKTAGRDFKSCLCPCQ